ncbi:endonuclease [Nitrogeniibacter mangrovi]|uniref:Endonuclease n=1 Tax=Nitrogeniibacter mangrovi TaxID=2016596 RepID=A0A6C1BAQ1_9RHOO|nr:endonuclease/exonuclease/phosphatase family protein [Nitrogeniibacter mangrovi]QID19778.1 endonuclease [Nitrogeniibacter mangrovi]
MRVISWNIQWGRGADGRVNLSRLLDDLSCLGDFDVICLQEVASRFPGLPGGAEEDEVALLRAAFPEHTLIGAPGVDVPHPGGGRSRFGNVVLSRLPVGAVVRHRLPWPPAKGTPSMPRTAVEAVLMPCSGHPVRIITTHLEYYAADQRMAQVEKLRQLQLEAAQWAVTPQSAKEADGPFARPVWPEAAIVCGDFNFAPDAPEWARMTAVEGGRPVWSDAWFALNPGQPHPPSVGLHGAEWPDHRYCCDYFFVSRPVLGALRSVVYDACSAASDHQPVMLEVDEAAIAAA